MESARYNDKKLESYLHGELPEAEIAALEDELLHNDELFQYLEAVEMNLIDSYLENEMTNDEKTRFEAGFLSNPANQLKLDEARVFRESLEQLQEMETTTPNVARIPGHRQTFFDSLRRHQLAAAAIVLIGIAVVIAWLAFRSRNQKPSPLNTQVIPRVTPESSPTPPLQPSPSPSGSPSKTKPANSVNEQWLFLRDATTGVMGSGDDLPITLSPENEILRLGFELLDDARDKDSFRVSIKDRMGYPLLSPIEVTPKQIRHLGLLRRVISLDVPVKDLKTGERYRFEIAEPYAFRIFVVNKKAN